MGICKYSNFKQFDANSKIIMILIFGAAIIDGFSFGIDGYDVYHHFSTPSLLR